MKPELPPLASLRAFEAAGRHLSISRAAEELHVTPTAVSHQVRALEEHLGVKLLRRVGNALSLTDAGRTCLPGLQAGFVELSGAVESLLERDLRGSIVLSVAPIFAAKWLIPRLGRFRALHPGIDARIAVTTTVADLEQDGVDAAIRGGHGTYPGLAAHRLFGESLVPMCSPSLARGPHPLETPEDLRHHVLLHFEWPAFQTGWDAWLETMGIDGVDAAAGPRFTQADHAIQAAIAGSGVVLGFRAVAQDDLDAGLLVVPFDRPLRLEIAYYLVYPETQRERPKLVAFRDWILEEARAVSDPAGPSV